MTEYLADCEPGTVAVIDYLQILDQKRSKPPLADQILSLAGFARQNGAILGLISQIDRSFDTQTKTLPDMRDIRLPNLVDLTLFTKACFLHAGEIDFRQVA